MSDRAELPSDSQLEAYLDGLLAGTEKEAFEARLRHDPILQEQVELQSRIDSTLVGIYPSSQPSIQHLEALSTQMAEQFPATRRVPWWIIGTAAAASIAGVLLFWRTFENDRVAPVFQPQSLAQVYAQSVESGFTPYYKCDEADRFAAVFDRRQGQPLKLLPLPKGIEMLGISYPGGLSRDSTAMLCRVDGQPVIVLVDRATADRSDAIDNGNPALHVFREERDGLVFYEVTPFDSARVIEYLAIASNRSGT